MNDPSHADKPLIRLKILTVSKDAHDFGQKIAAAAGESLAVSLNQALTHFIGPPYHVISGLIADDEGQISAPFESLVCAFDRVALPPDGDFIPADAVAVVIDATADLNESGLRDAYRRIAVAKALKKSPPPNNSAENTATLGVVFAQRSTVPLETLTTLLEALNSETPSTAWPDLVVVGSVGTIEYGVQFPGEKRVSGLWMPPAPGALERFIPAVHVVMVKRPAGDYAFSKMLSIIAAHLRIFRQEPEVAVHTEFLDAVSNIVVTVAGYQYDLGGRLRAVPEKYYNDMLVPQLPFQIEDPKGNVLSTISFMPWQDGGAVILRGKLPLEGTLVFGTHEFRSGGILRPSPELQISHVLPITDAQFGDLLKQFQARSNMRVTRGTRKWTVQKVANEGTASPFMARLMLGILRIRDTVYGDDAAALDRFDRSYELVSSALTSAREAMQALDRDWQRHSLAVASGEIVERSPHAVMIKESIDREMRRECENFLNSATRTLKHGMQNLIRELGLDIGFLFKKQATFEAGLAKLRGMDPELASYIERTRDWSGRLIGARNATEHDGWVLPRTTYHDDLSGTVAIEPTVQGVPVTQFANQMFDRLCCFVEEVSMHALKQCMPAGVTLTEIPPCQRRAVSPERFTITLAAGGLPPWMIAYSAAPFDQL